MNRYDVLSVRVRPDVKKILQQRADEVGVSLSQLVNEVLTLSAGLEGLTARIVRVTDRKD